MTGNYGNEPENTTRTLDEIGTSLAQASRELPTADRVRLTEALWVALSTQVGGLALGRAK